MQKTEGAKNVIITEKADAARRIAYILSDGKSKQKRSKGLNYIEFGEDGDTYVVIPLSGHIVAIDFPDSMKEWKSTNLETLTSSGIVHRVTNKSAFNSLIALTSRLCCIVKLEQPLPGGDKCCRFLDSPECDRLRGEDNLFFAMDRHWRVLQR